MAGDKNLEMSGPESLGETCSWYYQLGKGSWKKRKAWHFKLEISKWNWKGWNLKIQAEVGKFLLT